MVERVLPLPWIRATVCLLVLWTAARVDAQNPLTFDDLVARARTIVVATVSARQADWEHYGASRLIITRVTLDVEQSLKGSAPRRLTVDMLGGTIGDETLRVSHVPEFRVGDRDVLFLNDTSRAVSPLVGSDQGRFRVVNDTATGQPRVLTAGWQPLRSVAEIDSPRQPLVTSMSSAMTLDAFAAAIRGTLRTIEARRP